MNAVALITGFVVSLALIAGVLYLIPQLYRWIQLRRWRRLSGVMALTYDDGPDQETSVALLDLLQELDVKATFYLVGFRAERAPDVVEMLSAQGHELGTHSYSHKHAWRIAPWVDCNDAERAYRTLGPVVGHTAPYRPPFGKISLLTLVAMLARGRRVEWWTRPTNDTSDEFDDPDRLASAIVDEGQPVVLMHSHHEERHRREFMLNVTRALVSEARKRNIRLVTMRELSMAANL